MKDKLLEHHLPPNVLVELSLTSTKLYRRFEMCCGILNIFNDNFNFQY